jgi:hypothetical protein
MRVSRLHEEQIVRLLREQERWRYIIECSGLCVLKRPFDVGRAQVSSKDYGAAVRYVYVEPEDEVVLRTKGYLDCA